MTFEVLNICGQGLFMKLDGFRLIYCLVALFMWSVSLLFSKEYFAHYSHKARYYGFLILTMFATLGVFLSADFLTMFIFFEIMSISSYVWVAQEETVPCHTRYFSTKFSHCYIFYCFFQFKSMYKSYMNFMLFARF